ncbi:MAG: hypothetical protein MUC48_26875 [Leptolyngbya sp. Prado105]|nr:hypothetical protein [Leptolyngbya sp. Prado105]
MTARQQMRDFLAAVQPGITPARLVQFGRRLLKGVEETPELHGFAAQDPQFLGTMMQFASAYALANPDIARDAVRQERVSVSWQGFSGVVDIASYVFSNIWSSLNWRNFATLSHASITPNSLVHFLRQMPTSARRLQLMRSSRNLLLASVQCGNLRSNRRYLDSLLLRVAEPYAALEPEFSGTVTEDLFLHRLWMNGDKDAIAESAFWLNQFFEGVQTQADVDQRIAFGERLLQVVRELRSTSTLVS